MPLLSLNLYLAGMRGVVALTDLKRSFPEGFLWGTATASYQVEGAVKQDGRGPSVWDTFSHTPGRVKLGHTGDIACDQYNRYREDVAIMKKLGFGAHRFSISWSRVMPSGRGVVNQKGLDYYRRFIDELLEADIEPWVTMFHWDLPQALQDDFGGWKSKDTSRYFADYCGTIAGGLGDIAKKFMTINEFVCFTDGGYGALSEVLAPGETLDAKGLNMVRHNALLAHGMGVQAIRAAVPTAEVGIAENASVCVPAIETDENIAAARKAYRERNAPFLTAVMEGKYLDCYLEEQGENAPEFNEEEMKIISSPLDFVGHNMYLANHIIADSSCEKGYRVIEHPSSYPHMGAPWIKVSPEITYWAPRFLSELWGVKEIYITENGCACSDEIDADGKVNDLDRIFYLRNHLHQAQRATAEGIPLKGYFCWSLLDNFEWADGYTYRFGIVHVDYETLKRTPKMSADYLGKVVAANRVL